MLRCKLLWGPCPGPLQSGAIRVTALLGVVKDQLVLKRNFGLAWIYNLLLRSQHVCLAFLLRCACGHALQLCVACQFCVCECLAGLACGLTPTSSLLVRGTASSVRAHGVWPCSNATE